MKYITNNSNDPHYNLAFEEYCFKNLPIEEEFVFLWINGPAIIVGKNQNTIEEINNEYIKANNIKIVRRITGGGAVYHDLGNLNYSFIKNSLGKEKIDFGEINIPILKALSKFGITAELTGRNDLTVEGKKISGIAQSVWKKRILNHGTILYDTDLSVLSQTLNVKSDKIESKGVKSVKSRVSNIKPFMNYDVDIIEFKSQLLKNIFEYINEEPIEYKLDKKQLEEIESLYNQKYKTWEWNYGESPDFDHKSYKRFESGSIDLRIQASQGIIKDIAIFGDFFGTKDTLHLKEKLIGKRFDKEEILEALKDEDLSDYFGKITTEEFIDMIF